MAFSVCSSIHCWVFKMKSFLGNPLQRCSHLQAVSEAYCRQKMLIFHVWQILVQTALCFRLFKVKGNEQEKVKSKKLKARKKYQKSRSHLKSRGKRFVSATCQKKGISLAKFMHRSHKSNVTKDEWHFLFVLVFTVGFSKCGHFQETHCKDAVIFRQSVKPIANKKC